jgi:hypothetical protein
VSAPDRDQAVGSGSCEPMSLSRWACIASDICFAQAAISSFVISFGGFGGVAMTSGLRPAGGEEAGSCAGGLGTRQV